MSQFSYGETITTSRFFLFAVFCSLKSGVESQSFNIVLVCFFIEKRRIDQDSIFSSVFTLKKFSCVHLLNELNLNFEVPKPTQGNGKIWLVSSKAIAERSCVIDMDRQTKRTSAFAPLDN